MALRSTELIGNLEALNENIVSRLFQVNLMTTYLLPFLSFAIKMVKKESLSCPIRLSIRILYNYIAFDLIRGGKDFSVFTTPS